MKNTELLYREKRSYAGGVVEIVVWRVPEPVPPSEHPFKYRLVFVRDGKRVIGYDNERGKGDHRHSGKSEMPYQFVNELQLLDDFWQDVKEVTK
ncbi:MAG: hypothetical protein HZC43_04465 [Nitrosomonadales bacterium]|nr:hypothetical protein [Nitrosomonadales bacterium]